MKGNIFVIGDENTNEKAYYLLQNFQGVEGITYEKLLEGKDTISENGTIFLTFPNKLWDLIVEKKGVVYGSKQFGKRIVELVDLLAEKLETRFPNNKYVNDPKSIMVERDKIRTKDIAINERIKVPENIFSKDEEKHIDKILDTIGRGETIYIKVRYGSMGKGITMLSKDKWITNFEYDGKNILNHSTNYNWIPKDVTGNLGFLERLIEEDVIIEKAINNSLTNGFKFDMRTIILYGKKYSDLTYGRATDNSHITNVSQKNGRRLSLKELLKLVPRTQIEKGMEMVRLMSSRLGLNYTGGDILFEGENFEPVFIEINSFPGLADEKANILIPRLYGFIKEQQR